MKKLFLLGTIFSLLLSCNNDNDNQSLVNEPRLIKIEEVTLVGDSTGNDIESFVEFEYNKNGFVSKQLGSGGEIHNFIYNEDNNIIRLDYTSGSESSYSINYTYANGLIASEVYNNGNTRTFEYNTNNQLIRINTSDGSVNYTYDSNGNVSEELYDGVINDSFQYDNMNNPRFQMYPIAFNKINLTGPNNMIFRENVNRSITYEYNSNDLPISSTLDSSGTVLQTRKYIYE